MNKGWLELESDPGEPGHGTAQLAVLGTGRGTARGGQGALRDTRAAGPGWRGRGGWAREAAGASWGCGGTGEVLAVGLVVYGWSFAGPGDGGELVKFGGGAVMGCAGEVLGGWGCGCTGEAAVVREHKSGLSPSRCPGVDAVAE